MTKLVENSEDIQNNYRFLYKFQTEKQIKASNYRLLRTYGITTEDYDAMSTYQGHICKICKKSPKNTRLNVDHRHVNNYKKLCKEEKRKEVRGLLCFRCNTALGGLERNKESRQFLQGVVEYFQIFRIKGDI